MAMIDLRNVSRVLSIDEAREVRNTQQPIFVRDPNYNNALVYVYSDSVSADELDEYAPNTYLSIKSNVLSGGWVLVSRPVRVAKTLNEIINSPDFNVLYYYNGMLYRATTTSHPYGAPYSAQSAVNSSIYWVALGTQKITLTLYVSESGNDTNDGLTPSTPIRSTDAIVNKFGSNQLPYVVLKLVGDVSAGYDFAPHYRNFYVLGDLEVGELIAENVNFVYPNDREVFIEGKSIKLLNSTVTVQHTSAPITSYKPFFKAQDEFVVDDTGDWSAGTFNSLGTYMDEVLPRYIAEIQPSTKIVFNVGGILPRTEPYAQDNSDNPWAVFKGYSENLIATNLGNYSLVYLWSHKPEPVRLFPEEDLEPSGYGALNKIKATKKLDILIRRNESNPFLSALMLLDESDGNILKPVPVNYMYATDTSILTKLSEQPLFYLYPLIDTELSYIYMRSPGKIEVTLDPNQSYLFIAPHNAVIDVYTIEYSNSHPIDIDTVYTNGYMLSTVEIDQSLFNSSLKYDIAFRFTNDATFSSYTHAIPDRFPPSPGTKLVVAPDTQGYDIRYTNISPLFPDFTAGPSSHPNSIWIPDSLLAEYWMIKAVSTTGAPPRTIGVAYYGRMDTKANPADYELYQSDLYTGTFMGWRLKNLATQRKTFLLKVRL